MKKERNENRMKEKESKKGKVTNKKGYKKN